MNAAESWLQLLLRDASAEELDAYRRMLLAAGTPAHLVESEARQALQLHSLLRDRTRRATELAALSDIATQLTSVHDLTELLGNIAAQARRLLRCDIAYIALAEGDELRIRFFDGMLNPTARDLRLSMASGLVGRIVATRKPSWTDDYLGDATITHHPAADEFAAEEQIRSILGVPLFAHDTVLGALFAAERSRRPFTDGEIGLLTGLAAHAAVAIENARLFEAERRSAEELRANAASVAQAVALHERLTNTAVRGGGPAAVVLALADVLHGPVQLLDADDVPLAGPNLADAPVAPRFTGGDRRTLVVPDDTGDMVLCPVIAAEEYLGCVVMRGYEPVADAQIRLVERGALAIALSLVQERAVTAAVMRSRGDLLAALVEGGDHEILQRQAVAAGVDLRKPHVLALVAPEDTAARGVCIDLAQRHAGLVVERAGRTLLLVPARTDLAPLAPVSTAAVSAPVTGASSLPDAYASVRRCLQAMLALGKRNTVGGPETLGMFQFLLSPEGPDEAAAFIRRTIGPLLDHDAARGTQLAETLEAYLASGRQHTAAAKQLHIHPNTLYQRLSRIAKVLRADWRDANTALDLHIALRLHRLAETL